MDRNEGASQKAPYDGADVAGEEACFHAEDDADYRRDEGEETEVNHSRDDRYLIQVSPEYAGEYAGEYAEDDAIDNAFQKGAAGFVFAHVNILLSMFIGNE